MKNNRKLDGLMVLVADVLAGCALVKKSQEEIRRFYQPESQSEIECTWAVLEHLQESLYSDALTLAKRMKAEGF